jgi:2-polyprenyl-6-methoxyphenol hydroxylase-like FAD-dependent oxidoreductase
MARHAEIAGAGFSGLVAAVALLQRGWTVRVHERTPLLRSEGFGISIHENGRRVFAALGALDAIMAKSIRVHRRLVRNGSGEVTADRTGKVAVHRVSRQNIVATLAAKAAALGGEIATDSAVASAEPEGALVLEDGRRFKADLIIGADGYNSRVRESVDLLAQRIVLRDGAMRLIIPRGAEERAADPEGCATGSENWSGTRRVVYGACAADEVYMALSCLYGDEDGMAVPVRTDAWRRSLPYLGDAFDRIDGLTEWDRVKWVRFQTIKLKRWSRGRVAIVGDAAHAMPPNLGQGGNCAIMNAFSLAVALESNNDLQVGLALWERNERPITEYAQRWSRLYGAVTLWPERLRNAIFGMTERSSWLRSRLERTARYVPTGV